MEAMRSYSVMVLLSNILGASTVSPCQTGTCASVFVQVKTESAKNDLSESDNVDEEGGFNANSSFLHKSGCCCKKLCSDGNCAQYERCKWMTTVFSVCNPVFGYTEHDDSKTSKEQCAGGAGPYALQQIKALMARWSFRGPGKEIMHLLKSVKPESLDFVIDHLDLAQLLKSVQEPHRSDLLSFVIEQQKEFKEKTRARSIVALARVSQHASEEARLRVDAVVRITWKAFYSSQRGTLFNGEEAELVAAAAHRSLAASLMLFHNDRFGDDALAQNDTSQIPEDVRAKGENAIDAVATAALNVFPDKGIGVSFDGEELTDLLATIGITELKNDLDLTEFKDVVGFVKEVGRLVKLNPVLVAFGAEWSQLPAEYRAGAFLTGPAADADVRKAVVYCFLLHAITKKVMYEPKPSSTDAGETFMEKVVNTLTKTKERVDWKRYFGTFESLKVMTVYRPMLKEYVPLKRGKLEIDDAESSGWLLSINILEAMYADLKRGFEDNAEAAFELMIESNDGKLSWAGGGTDEEWELNGKKMGVKQTHFPLNKAWCNLYSSWNLAFVSTYSDRLMFYAKLLNPVTLGTYQETEQGLYLFPRVMALFTHLHYVMARAAAAKTLDYSVLKWTDEVGTSLWGKLNREAARQYQHQLETIITANQTTLQRIAGDKKRVVVKQLWSTLSSMIRGSKAMANGGQAVADFFETLIEQVKKVFDLMQR